MAEILLSDMTEYVTLLQTTDETDDGGGVIVNTASSGVTVWAKIEQLQSTQNQNESTVNNVKAFRATVRSNNDIIWKARMVLKWNFRPYNVTSIKDKTIGKFDYKIIDFNEIYDG
jgi:head-tail adaptor